jgi:hypothetical protein
VEIAVSASQPFSWQVKREGKVLADAASSLTFFDQLWLINFKLNPGVSLFGLGESSRKTGFRLRPGTTFTLWSR